MALIYDWQGNKHDLTLGAFDSQSLTNPDHASIYLYSGLQSIEDGTTHDMFKQLSQKYISKQKTTFASSIWNRFKDQLPQIRNIGGTLGTTLFMAQVRKLAGTNAAVLGALTAAELVLGQVFSTGTTKRTFAEPLPGQWVFIESDSSYRRRLSRLAEFKTNHLIKTDPSHPIPTSVAKATDKWALGFFVRTSSKFGHVVVFNTANCKETLIRVARLMNVPPELGEQLDNQEELSSLREIYMLKEARDKKTFPDNNFWPGRLVTKSGDYSGKNEYRVVAASQLNVVVVDTKGAVFTFPKADLAETGTSRSNPGIYDNYFLKSGKSTFYMGMWAWSPIRPEIATRFGGDYELACIAALKDDRAMVYYVIDGNFAAPYDKDLVATTDEEQAAMTKARETKKFREMVIKWPGDPNKVKANIPTENLHRYVTSGYAQSMQRSTPQYPEPVDDPKPKEQKIPRNQKADPVVVVDPLKTEEPKEVAPPEEAANGMILVMVGIMAVMFAAQFV